MPLPRGSDPERAIFGYINALHGLPLEAVEHGIRKFLRGECEDVSRKFCPHPPELAEICRTSAFARAPSSHPASKLYGYHPPKSKVIKRGISKGRAFELIDMGVYPKGSIWCPGPLTDKPEIGDLYGPGAGWKGPWPLPDMASSTEEAA